MVLAESLSESEATRRIFLTAGGLGLLGLLLLIVTVWWWRSTRSDHPALARLEVLSTRRWAKASDPERARMMAKARPAGTEPGPQLPPEPEPVDLSILAAGDHAGFDDLREIDLMLGLDLPGAPGARITPIAPAPSEVVPIVPASGGEAPMPEAQPAAGVEDPPAEGALGAAGAVEPAAADHPPIAAVARALGTEPMGAEVGAMAPRETVSTMAAAGAAVAANPLEGREVGSYEAADDEDATTAIGLEAIDPLLQRTTNPD